MKGWIAYLLLIIGIITILIIPVVFEYSNEQTTTIIVKDKYVKGDLGTYFIVDTDNNAYVIKDLIFKGKYNSTDLYNELEIGKTYEIETTGIRNQFFSFYKNINKIKEK